MSVHERIAAAISGGRMGAPGDVETVMAMAWTRSPHDALFWRKYAHSGGRFDAEARAVVAALAEILAERGRWGWSEHKVSSMAETVYQYWLNDTCPACQGRGYDLPEGSPYLSDVACSACDPDRPGRRPFPWIARQRMLMKRFVGRGGAKQQAADVEAIGVRHKALLCRIELAEADTGERVIRKLAQRSSE